jgi:hypothetical protein
LLKRGQNYRLIGIELLDELVENVEVNSIERITCFKYYSYDDVIIDLLEFIGGPDLEIKRNYVSKNFLKFIKILSHEAKKDLFTLLLNDILKLNTKNINDAKSAFIIFSLKCLLTEYIKKSEIENNSMFQFKFLNDIINLSVNHDLFVIDILESISQGINFLHFILIQDKIIFNGNLGFYNKTYLYEQDKKLGMVGKLIEKWVNSTDEEKMKHVNIDTSEFGFVNNFAEKREELKQSFNLRKNQALMCLSMINNAEKLIMNYLNIISNKK